MSKTKNEVIREAANELSSNVIGAASVLINQLDCIQSDFDMWLLMKTYLTRLNSAYTMQLDVLADKIERESG